MKNVVTTPEVDLALRTLNSDEARRVHAWFLHFANWDNDSFLQANSHVLEDIPGVRVLRTGSDLRIFFSIEGNTITILDVAKKQAILRTGSH